MTTKLRAIEFLRNVYAASGLSIRPKTHVTKTEALKEMVRAFGLDPEKVLVKEALAEPHRTVLDPLASGERELRTLTESLKRLVKEELLTEMERYKFGRA